MLRSATLFLLVLLSGPLFAQISPGGVVNIASFAPQGLPNANIARGSLFTVFGQGLAAEGLAQAAFPLPFELGDASIEVEVGGVVRDCPMVFTTPGQVAALLPSDVPAGNGQIRLTFANSTFVAPITVVNRTFGILTRNQRGNGLATFQNFVSQNDQPINGPTRPIAPGSVGTLWGVGLGPVQGDETAGPLPQDLGRDLQVYVGDVLVTNILYAGRSGCCAGVDQIVFAVPDGVAEGCYIPLTVVLDGIPSNYAMLSIGEGQFCGDPDSFSADETEAIASDNDFRFGRIDVSRIDWAIQGESVLEEQASATFRAFGGPDFLLNPSFMSSGDGTCLVRMVSENPATQGVIAPFAPLDAGVEIPYDTPDDSRVLAKFDDAYVEDIADLAIGGVPSLLPGSYRFRGQGGPDVGEFEASTTVSTLTEWTNRDEIAFVDRAEDLTVRWQGGDPADRVLVFGVSMGTNRAGSLIGASFVCDAPLTAGEFTVPPYVLAALPPSGTRPAPILGQIPDGTLQVGVDNRVDRFQAPGLDTGFTTWVFTDGLLGLEYR